MKKICLTVLSTVCALCAAFGVVALNVQSVSADTAVTLSATKIMKSTAQDKMLLATAITGVESVYEVGYLGLTDVQTISAETTTYYTDITTGEKTWSAEEIFGESYATAGMIIWEIEYDPSEEYTFQAYAKYGEVSEGEIVMNDPETIEYGTQRTVEQMVESFKMDTSDPVYLAAFGVLKNTSSWGSFYHGYPYLTGSDSSSVWTNACKASSDKVGFTWTRDAINQIIDLGFKKIRFTVTSASGQYIAMYFEGNQSAEWISGDFVKDATYNYIHYFASGSTITVDLVTLMANIGSDSDAPTAAFKFALTNGTSWTGSGATTKVTFTNVQFAKISKSEQSAHQQVKGLAVLKDANNWGSYYHGWPYATGYDETSVWTNACKANSPQVGFIWKAAAINEMMSLGFKKISFNVSSDSEQYIAIYLANESKGWISGDYTTDATYSYIHYFEEGARVTVDLTMLGGQDLQFALTPVKAWNAQAATQSKVTFTEITFEEMTEEEKKEFETQKLFKQAFAVLQNTSNWGTHYHGYPSSTGSDATSVWTTPMAGNGLPGFTWTNNALNSIIDLGFESVTFTVTTANGAHVAIYFTGDYGYNWIGGDVAYLDDTTYYFASGARVTIGLKEVMDNLGADGSYPTAAIKFVITNGTQWTAAPSQKVTFSNFVFEEEYTLQGEQLPAEERAMKLLKSQNAYDSHYHGTLNSVTVNENSVTLAVSKGAYSNSAVGFMIKRSVISNLYRIGIDKLSFKVEASASYIGLYFTNSYKLTYASGYQSVVEGNTDCTYYYASGSTVTIDIVALMGSKNFANGSGDDGIKMLVMQSASWDPVPSTATVTLSNFSVEEFTFENANTLTLVTTTGDFYGSYDSGSYFCGDLASDKAVLKLLYDAGFRYVDLSMYSFNSSSDYMQTDWRTKIAELKAYATSLGMTFVQAHSQGGNGIDTNTAAVDTFVQQTIRQIEICGELGIENIVVHAGWRAGYDKAQWFEANKAFYEKLLPTAAACGVNVLCENSTAYNMGNNYYINTGADMREFIEYVNHPNFHGCWDTGHANCEGEQYDDIIALGDEMYAIHFAENMGVGDTHVMPYFGNLNVASVMRALKEIGFDGYFVFECDGRDRMNGTWKGPDELDDLVGENPSLMTRLEQEKLLYATGEYILRTYGMLAE